MIPTLTTYSHMCAHAFQNWNLRIASKLQFLKAKSILFPQRLSHFLTHMWVLSTIVHPSRDTSTALLNISLTSLLSLLLFKCFCFINLKISNARLSLKHKNGISKSRIYIRIKWATIIDACYYFTLLLLIFIFAS